MKIYEVQIRGTVTVTAEDEEEAEDLATSDTTSWDDYTFVEESTTLIEDLEPEDVEEDVVQSILEG